MEEVKAQSYTLRTESGQWLGQIVLTSDGMFSAVTDYGTAGYTWRSFGDGGLDGFKKFICGLSIGYFSDKIYSGALYMVPMSKKFESACNRFSENILPELQRILKSELQTVTPQP